jgi:hypothetical protein
MRERTSSGGRFFRSDRKAKDTLSFWIPFLRFSKLGVRILRTGKTSHGVERLNTTTFCIAMRVYMKSQRDGGVLRTRTHEAALTLTGGEK